VAPTCGAIAQWQSKRFHQNLVVALLFIATNDAEDTVTDTYEVQYSILENDSCVPLNLAYRVANVFEIDLIVPGHAKHPPESALVVSA